MRKIIPWLLLVGVLGGVCPAMAQMDRPELDLRDEDAKKDELVGPWLTERMMDGLMNKFADDMARRYDMDDDQRWQTRQVLQESFPEWLNERRGRIQPLINYYVESLLHDEPPDPAVVATWADEVLPLVEEFDEMLEGTTDQMRDFLTEDQQIRLEGEMAAYHVAGDFLRNRLHTWSAGEFDPVTEWPKGQRFEETRRARDEEMQAAVQQAERETVEELLGGEAAYIDRAYVQEGDQRGDSAAAASRPNDPWAQYVEEFIKKYDLNADQQGAARNILYKMQEQRDDYLRRVDRDINSVEARLVEAETDAQKEMLIAKYERLAEPVFKKFQILKERLNKLPTRAQRRAAAEKEAELEQSREDVAEEAVRRASEPTAE